jgi:hypothetical protein
MIADVGLIIALYAIIRYIQMFGQPREQTSIVAKVFAGFALVLTVVFALDLAMHGATQLPATQLPTIR